MRINYLLRFRRPTAAVLGALVVGTLSLADTAHADEWDSTNREGIPLAMTRDRWGDRGNVGDNIGMAEWSYPRYPLNCSSATSPAPAFQFIWVTDAGNPKVPYIDVDPKPFRDSVRRAASVFAASANQRIATRTQKLFDHTPRFVTSRDRFGSCQPLISRATVPRAVLQREPYQYWLNPRTGKLEMGMWPWLETLKGFDDPNRHYITITDSPVVWNYLGGATSIPGGGIGYGPADDQPGPQNLNNIGGTWTTVSTNNTRDYFDTKWGGDFAEILAHELAHGMGAVLPSAPHYNPDNQLHPSDCADLLCYNHVDKDGQTYLACGPRTATDWWRFVLRGGDNDRDAYRLDCNRDDYFAIRADGSGKEMPWANQRWAGNRNRFFWGNQNRAPYRGPAFSNTDYSIPPQCTYDNSEDAWCPPGVKA